MRNQAASSGVLTFLSENVKRHRTAAGLSQTALAERAGLSRRTITALEAGDINISMTRVDAIAEALGTTFVNLVSDPARTDERLEVRAWRGRSSESEAKLLAAAPASSETQLWVFTLGPGDSYQAEPDPVGWSEMIYVVEGLLEVQFANGVKTAGAGDFLAYPSSQPYAYRNAGEVTVRFIRNVIA